MEEINKKQITDNTINVIQKYIDNHKLFLSVVKHGSNAYIEDIKFNILFVASNNFIELYFSSSNNIETHIYKYFVFDNFNINFNDTTITLYNSDLKEMFNSGVILKEKDFEKYKMKKQLENF